MEKELQEGDAAQYLYRRLHRQCKWRYQSNPVQIKFCILDWLKTQFYDFQVRGNYFFVWSLKSLQSCFSPGL